MNKHPKNKFSWCPVCMIHTYHVWNHQEWQCLNEDHELFLKYRQDPWIEEYRQQRQEALSVSQQTR